MELITSPSMNLLTIAQLTVGKLNLKPNQIYCMLKVQRSHPKITSLSFQVSLVGLKYLDYFISYYKLYFVDVKNGLKLDIHLLTMSLKFLINYIPGLRKYLLRLQYRNIFIEHKL
jgi:hypothetical protein